MKVFKKMLAVLLAVMLLMTAVFAQGESSPIIKTETNSSDPGPAENGPETEGMTQITVSNCVNGTLTAVCSDDTSNQVLHGSSKDVKNGTKIRIEAQAAPGYALKEIKYQIDGGDEKTVADGETVVASGSKMTFTATFEEKLVKGDGAAVDTYEIKAICSGMSNWANYTKYQNEKDTEKAKKYTKYSSAWGGRSEIVSGDYVDLILTVVDPDFKEVFKDDEKEISSIAVSTPGSSAFRLSSNTRYPSGKTLKKTEEGYEITLTGLAYGGGEGDLVLLVSGKTYNAKLSVNLKNATPRPVTPEDEKPDVPMDSAKPYVIIKSYSYGGGDLVAGETRNVTMTFYNTSKEITVENMMVTMSLPADAMVTSSSNTFYVESLEPQKSITKTVNVTVKPTAPAQSQSMAVNFTYDYIDNGVRKNASTDESISMPVLQVDRFTVTGAELDPQIFAGQEASLSIPYVNKGRSEVYNISAKLSCPALQNDGEEQYIGNLASGTTSSADFYVIANEAGPISGEVIITYEDTNMNEQTVTVPFSATVINYEEPTFGPEDPGMMEGPDMMEEPHGFAWYWIVLIVAAVAAGVVIFLRKRNEKKENVDEDEDF